MIENIKIKPDVEIYHLDNLKIIFEDDKIFIENTFQRFYIKDINDITLEDGKYYVCDNELHESLRIHDDEYIIIKDLLESKKN